MIDFQEDKKEIDFQQISQSQSFNTSNIDFQPETQNNGIDFQPTKLEGKVEYNEHLSPYDFVLRDNTLTKEQKVQKIKEIGEVDFLKREVKYENSRFDLYYQKGDRKGFIEVKGVTLEEGGVAKFPDAPTERGAKHLRELIKAKEEGYEAAALFVIQMKGVTEFRPNAERDKVFAEALREAADAGVKILAYDCSVQVGKVCIDQKVPVNLS